MASKNRPNASDASRVAARDDDCEPPATCQIVASGVHSRRSRTAGLRARLALFPGARRTIGLPLMARLPPVSDLEPASVGWGFFLCSRKELRTGRSGDFLSIV